MAFPKNLFLIETQVISRTIYRKTIDLFILFIIGNFNLFSNYLLNAHCVQMYKPKFLSSNSLKSIWKKKKHIHHYLEFKANVICVNDR